MPRTAQFIGLCVIAATVSVPGRVQAAGTFDGTYRGSQVATNSNESAKCAKLDHGVSITVTNDSITRKWGASKYGGDTLTAKIAPDGSFTTTVTSSTAGQRGYADSYYLRGQIAGGVLQAELGSNLCAVKITARKS